MKLTDYLFYNIRKEYIDSLSSGDLSADSSVIYRFFYDNEIARFEGDPYRYNPNIVSRRDAKSFRYQIMESYNAMYEAREKTGWKKGNYKEELNLTKILVQHVDEIPKRYTDGHMYGSELAFWLPLLAIVFDNNEINIEKLKTDSGFSGYLKALSKLKEMIAKEPKKVSIKLSKVKTSYYKTISDELLKSSLHSAVYDFLYNMGFPAVKTNESRITETRKSDKALDLINEFCIKHGETLVEYFNIDKDGDYRQMHGVIASKKQSLRSTRRNDNIPNMINQSDNGESESKASEQYDKLLECLSETDNRDIFLPLLTDPCGVGIYIIGQNYYRIGITDHEVPAKFRNIPCSLGVIVQYTRSMDNDDTDLYLEIKTQFDPYSNYEKMEYPYLNALYDRRRIIQEHNSANMESLDSETLAEINQCFSKLPEAAAFFLPSNRSEAVARRLSTEEKLLDKGMQAWKANKEKQLNNKILSNL